MAETKTIPAWQQLYEVFAAESILTEKDFEEAFKKWCVAVGYTVEQGNSQLFEIPERLAYELLKVHMY